MRKGTCKQHNNEMTNAYVGFGQPKHCFLLAERRLRVERCFHHWHSNSSVSGLDVKV
jgi:hypothetical protein